MSQKVFSQKQKKGRLSFIDFLPSPPTPLAISKYVLIKIKGHTTDPVLRLVRTKNRAHMLEWYTYV